MAVVGCHEQLWKTEVSLHCSESALRVVVMGCHEQWDVEGKPLMRDTAAQLHVHNQMQTLGHA